MYNLSIAVISLPDATERRKQIQRQINELNVEFVFFDAITGSIPELILQKKRWLRLNGRTLKASEIGCYASHYKLLEQHSKSEASKILIVLEDDVVLDTTYFNNNNEFVKLVTRFGYIRFNGQLMAPASEVFIQGRRRVVRFRKKVHGTLGYAVTVETAKKFVEKLQNLYRPIDIEMDRFWAHGIPILCLYQPVAIERSEPTSIGERGFTVTGVTWFLWKVNNQIEKIRCLWTNILYDLNIRKI